MTSSTAVDTRTGEIAVFGGSDIEHASPALAAEMVTAALVESRDWLVKAMEGTDPTPIAEFKAWAATVEEATKQKKLGCEIELDAAEMVRRSERGISAAIRNGQEAGEVATRASSAREREAEKAQSLDPTSCLPKPTEYASHYELYGENSIRDLTDGVSDEVFDQAIAEARAEENLSRTNVVRKVKTKTKVEAVEPDQLPQVPKPKRPGPASTRHVIKTANIRRVLGKVSGYQTAFDGITEIDPKLTSEEAADIADDLSKSIAALQRLNRLIKERTK